MVIKNAFIIFVINDNLIQCRPGNLLMDYFNNLFAKLILFIDNTSL
jgi:hypothetical protein